MIRNLQAALLLCLALPLLATAATAQPATAPAGPVTPAADMATAAKLRDAALDSHLAYDLTESLTTEVGSRLAGTEDEARARAWAVARLRSLGFKNVRIEPYTMPVWVRGEERARVVAPFPHKLAVTALGLSGATPAAGLTAPIVYFESLAALEAAPAGSLAGRIAFIDHRMMPTQDGSSYGSFGQVRRAGPSLAAQRGAAAVLIRSVGTDHHRNPHTGITGWADGVTPIPAAALAIPDAELLARIVSRGKPVTVDLTLTPRLLGDRESGNVIGEVPGSGAPDEIVLLGAHLDSWDLATGAIDDATGVAIVTAAAKLIMDNAPKPRRTIRVVLFGSEEVGGFGAAAYARAHGQEKHVLASESDFGADRVWQLGSRIGPDAFPIKEDMLDVLEPLGIGAGPNDSFAGADIEPLAALGTPTFGLAQDGTRYFDYHHTPDDTLDKVDPEQLAQNVAAWAAVTWIAASGDRSFGPAPPAPPEE